MRYFPEISKVCPVETRHAVSLVQIWVKLQDDNSCTLNPAQGSVLLHSSQAHETSLDQGAVSLYVLEQAKSLSFGLEGETISFEM